MLCNEMDARKLLIPISFLASASGAAAVSDGERYALPPSKVYIASCAREALRLHPGMIEVQRLRHLDGDFQMLYRISMHNGSEWIVLCDLKDGKIVRDEQALSNSAQQ
jgi:hypothetical protein